MSATEIRLNEDGTLDEVVGWGFFHLEQMDTHSWALILDTVDGKRVHLTLFNKTRRKVEAIVVEVGASTLATALSGAVDDAIATDLRRINSNRVRAGMEPLSP